MLGAIIVGGFLYLLSNGFLLCYWVNECRIALLFSSILFTSDSHGEAEHAGQQVYVREQVTVLNNMR